MIIYPNNIYVMHMINFKKTYNKSFDSQKGDLNPAFCNKEFDIHIESA